MSLLFIGQIIDAPLRQKGRNLQLGLKISRHILENLPQVRREEAKTIAGLLYEAAQKDRSQESAAPAGQLAAYMVRLEADERQQLRHPSATSPLRSKAIADFVINCAFELLDLMRQASSERTRLLLFEGFIEACSILGALVEDRRPAISFPVTQPSGGEYKLRILLVHGTWGRGFLPLRPRPFRVNGSWFEALSHFSEQLRELALLPTEFSAFLWTGSNSVNARHEAALRLARTVEENILKNPGDQHVIVSHSHGGNVALQAMHNLGQHSARVLLVTLATPFLQVFSNTADLRFRWISAATYMAAAAYIFHILFVGRTHIDNPVSFTIAGVMCLVIVWCLYRAAKAVFWIIADRKDRMTPINALQEKTNYRVNDQQRILVLRGVSDEASLSLATGSAIGALSRVVSIILTGFGKFLFIVGLGGVISSYIGLSSEFSLGQFLLAMYAWSIVLLLLMLCFRSAATIARTAFGREMLFLADGFEIDTSASPDSAENVRVITVAPNFLQGGLRHGLYNNPDAIKEMARWLFVNSGGGDYDAAMRRKEERMQTLSRILLGTERPESDMQVNTRSL